MPAEESNGGGSNIFSNDKNKGVIFLAILFLVGSFLMALRSGGNDVVEMDLDTVVRDNNVFLEARILHGENVFAENSRYEMIVHDEIGNKFVTGRTLRGKEILKEGVIATFPVSRVREDKEYTIKVYPIEPSLSLDAFFGRKTLASKNVKNNYRFKRDID